MWPAIGKLLLGIALSYVVSLFAPKPKPPAPASLEDFQIPQTTEGTEVGVTYGTVWIENAHVVWYGDLRTVAIKDKAGKK